MRAVKSKRSNRRWALSSALKFKELLWRPRCQTSGLGRRLAGATGNPMGQLHIMGSTSPSMGSVPSRALVFHTLAPSNRDQIRDSQNGTVTKSVTPWNIQEGN